MIGIILISNRFSGGADGQATAVTDLNRTRRDPDNLFFASLLICYSQPLIENEHGRLTQWQIAVLSVEASSLGIPHARQAACVERSGSRAQQSYCKRSFYLCSHTPQQLSPSAMMGKIRNH